MSADETKAAQAGGGRSSLDTVWEAVIVGGGVGGLTAAAYLARAGKRTLLVEARDVFSGHAENTALGANSFAPLAAEAFYSVDEILIHDLKLHQFGLRFSQRAMPLMALRPNGRHLKLPHELFSARAAILTESRADSSAYLRFRRELFALARRLRSLWLPRSAGAFANHILGAPEGIAKALGLSNRELKTLDLATRKSANAFLENWFESDILKTALAFDTALDGIGPDEPSSALLLFWRAAQESSGLQGAIGQIKGGPAALADRIADAARAAGAILCPSAKASSIDVENGRVAGLRLDDGTALKTEIVISSLCSRQTFEELLRPDVQPFGALRRKAPPIFLSSAKAYFTLLGLPPFAGLSTRELRGRLIVCEHPEAAAESKRMALLGKLPSDLVMEITIPTFNDTSFANEDVHIVAVRVPFLPSNPEDGWTALEPKLKKQILAGLETYAPGLNDRITGGIVITPEDAHRRYGAECSNSNFLERLLQSYEGRVRTAINGLYLCGLDAEPVHAITGRAGRAAASLALAQMTEPRAKSDE